MRHCRFRAFLACIVASILLSLPNTVPAQWKKLPLVVPFSNSYHGWSMYFFSEARGIVGYTAGPVYGIYLTTDGGNSWQKANVPSGYVGAITQIVMTDTSKGWASVEEPGTLPALWRTIDGGRNWAPTGIIGDFACVYDTKKIVTVTTRSKTRNGETSLDGGATFQANTLLRGLNGIDFVDSVHGVITCYTNTPWLRTTDGGVTWQPIVPQQTTEAWSVFGDKDSKIFYVAGEKDPNARGTVGNSVVMRSMDFGATWQTIYTFPFFTDGHITGAKGHLYIQVESTNYNGAYTGLYRSDDGGFTWKSVGGPRHENDKRFFVTGCNGGIVYAFDDKLSLWKTRNGGDGTIFEPNPEPLFMGLPITFSSRICDQSVASIKIANQYCDSLSILNAQFLDATSPVVTSGAISIINKSNFPRSIESGKDDSVLFLWDPSKYIHTDTSFAVQVRITFLSKALLTTRDTVITITAAAIGDSPTALLTPPQLSIGQIPFCLPKDSLFTLQNNGCDTLSILSAAGTAPINYQLLTTSLTPIVYPIRLAPGESFSYVVRLTLKKVGNYSSTITLKLRHQGKLRDTTLALSASISSIGSYKASDILDFGNVSICAPKDSTITLHNLSCDTLKLSKASLKNGTPYSIVNGVTPTENILPDSTKTITIRFAPTVLGTQNNILTLEFTSLGDPIILNIPITGIGTSGTASLTITPASDTLFSEKLNRCDAPKTFTIALANPGCKNVTIKSVTLSNPSLNILVTTTKGTPTTFNNGSGIGITTTVTPKTLGNWAGTMKITFQLENEAERDTILYYSLNVGFGNRVLEVTPTVIDFGTFKLCTTIDTTITFSNSGCDTLQLTNVQWSIDGGSLIALRQPSTTIPPGGKTDLRLHYIPSRAGVISGTVNVSSTSDSISPQIVTIIANVLPTDTIRLKLQPVRATFFAGDTLTIQLISETAIPASAGLRDIAFNINYNDDLFTLTNTPLPLIPNTNLLAGSSTRILPYKNRSDRFLFQGVPLLDIPANKPIIEYRFIVTLTDTTTTALFLNNIVLNGNDSVYAKCTLGFISSAFDLSLSLKCGDSILKQFLLDGKVIGLRTSPTFPNPITSRSNFKATLDYTSASTNTMMLFIIDGVGNVISRSDVDAKQGKNILTIDAQQLPSGDYHFLLSPNASPGEAISGKFVVIR